MGAPKKEISLTLLANLWGQSVPAVSNDLKRFGMTLATHSVEDCTKRKIEELRRAAQGRVSEDEQELRKQDLQLTVQLKQLQLAEKNGQLIDVAVLEPMLANCFVSCRTEFLSIARKIHDDIKATFGIDVPMSMIDDYIHDGLKHIAGYSDVLQRADASIAGTDGAAFADHDDAMGA